MINGIVDFAIVVSDGQKSLKWYTEVLGLEARDTGGHWITVAPKGSPTVLHLCQGHPLEPGNQGVALSTDDLDKTCNDLAAKGAKIPHPPKDDGWGVYATVEDPDGNVITLNPA